MLYLLRSLVDLCIDAHSNDARKESDTVRRFDGVTPYAVHPLWCAMTFLTETALPHDLRVDGYAALLLHDLLEDTTSDIPTGQLSTRIVEWVQAMTFAGGFPEEQKKIWDTTREVRLLKLYDKVSNLMDGSWMSEEKRTEYVAYILRLTEDVEREWGALNIVRIARAMCV